MNNGDDHTRYVHQMQRCAERFDAVTRTEFPVPLGFIDLVMWLGDLTLAYEAEISHPERAPRALTKAVALRHRHPTTQLLIAVPWTKQIRVARQKLKCHLVPGLPCLVLTQRQALQHVTQLLHAHSLQPHQKTKQRLTSTRM